MYLNKKYDFKMDIKLNIVYDIPGRPLKFIGPFACGLELFVLTEVNVLQGIADGVIIDKWK